MKKYLITFLFLFAMSTLLLGSQIPKKLEKTVSLTDVSNSLKKYQGNKDYDFVGNSIIYKVVEKTNYDNIFKESAIIYATIKQVRGCVDAINTEKIPVTTEFAIANIAFANKDLPEMKEKIKRLLDAIEKLNPKNDFKKTEMKKAATAAEGIKIAKNQLSESSKELPKLLDDLKGISTKAIK